MNIETKQLIDLAGWLVSLGITVGGLVTWAKTKLKDHDARFLTVDARLEAVEGKFINENNEPALLSYRAHDHICRRQNEMIVQEFRHVTAALNNNSQAVKSCGEQVAQLAIAVAVLEEKVGE